MNNNYPNDLLKFEMRMFNFKGKSLPEDKVIEYKSISLIYGYIL